MGPVRSYSKLGESVNLRGAPRARRAEGKKEGEADTSERIIDVDSAWDGLCVNYGELSKLPSRCRNHFLFTPSRSAPSPNPCLLILNFFFPGYIFYSYIFID